MEGSPMSIASPRVGEGADSRAPSLIWEAVWDSGPHMGSWSDKLWPYLPLLRGCVALDKLLDLSEPLTHRYNPSSDDTMK